jgi:hypothetical protein
MICDINLLKKHYGNDSWTIIDKEADQEFIDRFIKKQTKPIVFVGLNNMPWWHLNYYYNMHAQYKYYIDIDDATIIKQKCLRLFKNLESDEIALEEMVINNKNFLKLVKETIDRERGWEETIAMNKKWANDYANQEYIFMSRDDILTDIVDKLKNVLKSPD